MQFPRYYHGCGTIRNNILGARYANDIVVLGGLSNTDDSLVLPSTEIYDSAQNAWKFGPDFPTPIYGTQVVQYTSDTILASRWFSVTRFDYNGA